MTNISNSDSLNTQIFSMLRIFLCWGFNAGILEISAIDEADALTQITKIEWDMACAYGTNPECGVSNEVFK